MTVPYYDSDGITIYHGDCRDVLPSLEAASVNCCVTSPPYWGLRDYGTATWEGGDEGCDHKRQDFAGTASSGLEGGKGNVNHAREAHYRDTCGKCGAKRIDKQLGLEPTPEAYVETMVDVFREVWRVLADDGTLWLNLGDSYVAHGMQGGTRSKESVDRMFDGADKRGVPGLKDKDLVGIPWRVAFALQADGWYLRSDIIWHKPNPMPESVTDRPTKSHEYLFLLAKSQRYWYDADAIKEPGTGRRCNEFRRGVYVNNETFDNSGKLQESQGEYRDDSGRNRRSVWTIPTYSYDGAHFATFPPKLIEPCIKAGCPEGGLVLDPFTGSGTTAAVANKHGCRFVGSEINEEYVKMAVNRFVDAKGFRQRSLL